MASPDRTRLLDLLRRNVMRGDFTLSSGKRSSTYLDARRVTLSAEGSYLVGRLLLTEARSVGAEAVAGLTVGADPIVSAVAATAGSERQSIDGLIVRKETKAHGTSKRIEGPWRPGIRTLIVDDTLTTGASALEAATAVEREGGVVLGVRALVDREEGARERVQGAGFELGALFTLRELLRGES